MIDCYLFRQTNNLLRALTGLWTYFLIPPQNPHIEVTSHLLAHPVMYLLIYILHPKLLPPPSLRCQKQLSCGVTTVSPSSVETIFKLDEVLVLHFTFRLMIHPILFDKNIKPNQMRDNISLSLFTICTNMLFGIELTCRALMTSLVCQILVQFDRETLCHPLLITMHAIRMKVSTLISRTIVRNLTFFKQFSLCLERHI